MTHESKPNTNGPEEVHMGTWPADCLQRAFVDGAAWWEFMHSGSTIWRADRDSAEAEAIRRYGDPLAPAPASAPGTERESMETSEALRSEQGSRAREAADEFTCPRCSASHTRGAVNGVDSYRCLNCGYVGPKVETPPAPVAAHLQAEVLTDAIKGDALAAEPWVQALIGRDAKLEPFDPTPIMRTGPVGDVGKRQTAIERACTAAVTFLQAVPLRQPGEVRSRALMLRALASGVLELWPRRRSEMLEPLIALFEKGAEQLPGEGPRVHEIAAAMRSCWTS